MEQGICAEPEIGQLVYVIILFFLRPSSDSKALQGNVLCDDLSIISNA